MELRLIELSRRMKRKVELVRQEQLKNIQKISLKNIVRSQNVSLVQNSDAFDTCGFAAAGIYFNPCASHNHRGIFFNFEMYGHLI